MIKSIEKLKSQFLNFEREDKRNQVDITRSAAIFSLHSDDLERKLATPEPGAIEYLNNSSTINECSKSFTQSANQCHLDSTVETIDSNLEHIEQLNLKENLRTSKKSFSYPFEPFRTKIVEEIKMTTREERRGIIEKANFNLFLIKAEDVMIDLLTDSGTGAMSAKQTACLISSDESYAGSKSFYNFEKTVKEITNFSFIYPVHQGRAAERILFSVLCKPDNVVLSNALFDTTRGNIEFLGALGIDLPIEESFDTQNACPFKGNICLKSLEKKLKAQTTNVSFVLLTITCNSGGGQPVSMANIRGTKRLCDEYKTPLIIDGCRFAENAFFIKTREEEFFQSSIKEIVQEMFSYADAMTMSAKKDGIVHTGGWLAFRDPSMIEEIENLLVLTEGYKTYGGLAGRDLDAIAEGLKEVLDESYLKYRIESCLYLGEKIQQLGIPIVLPVGGHAVFIDARKFVPHIESLQFPAQALAVALYIEGGIRGVEIGSLMFGRQKDRTEIPAQHELLRLALPRRVYNKSHYDYIAKTLKSMAGQKQSIRGLKIIKEAKCLRHFNSFLAPI